MVYYYIKSEISKFIISSQLISNRYKFFKEWWGVVYKLSNTAPSPLATTILNSLNRRQHILLGNDILLAGIYNNPNYRSLLDKFQINKGKEALCDIAIRLKGLANDVEDMEKEEEATINEINSSESSVNEDDIELEKIID